jgi:hypothetical protein
MSDGVSYCQSVTLPGTEADLGSPLPVLYGQAAAVVAQLAVSGSPASLTAYLVLQGAFSLDGPWFDLAWIVSTSTSTPQTFYLSTVASAAAAFQQSRAAGTPPGSNGSVACSLPGLVRLVGQAAVSGGSSPKILTTARLKILGLR